MSDTPESIKTLAKALIQPGWNLAANVACEALYRYAELLEQQLQPNELSGWREAVIDALVVGCIYAERHDNDPRKAVHDLISWECQIALDPQVSSDADALIERGRRERDAEVAALKARVEAIQALVNEQAEDEGLWFIARTATEGYLQQELRRLHAAIEGKQHE